MCRCLLYSYYFIDIHNKDNALYIYSSFYQSTFLFIYPTISLSIYSSFCYLLTSSMTYASIGVSKISLSFTQFCYISKLILFKKAIKLNIYLYNLLFICFTYNLFSLSIFMSNNYLPISYVKHLIYLST